MFETFVVVWANILTVLAAFMCITPLALRNIPERYKKEVCIRCNDSRAEFDKNVKITWCAFRYAVYALIAQCVSYYVMYLT